MHERSHVGTCNFYQAKLKNINNIFYDWQELPSGHLVVQTKQKQQDELA